MAAADKHTRDLEIKNKERVRILRILLVVTLVVAMVFVGGLTYRFMSAKERNDFESQYKDSVVKVAKEFHLTLDMKVLSASVFSNLYTSRFGDLVNTSTLASVWPNVTMPDFANQASGLLAMSKGRAISFNPIINNETRMSWETYAKEQATQIYNSSSQLVKRSCATCWIVADGIFTKGIVNDSFVNIYDPGYTSGSKKYPDTLVPIWQIAPQKTNEGGVMFNLHNEPKRQRALDDMMHYKVPTLTDILQLVQDEKLCPSSILFYPVFASFHNEATTNVVTGSISIVFSWDALLNKLLPDYIEGMICVLKSSSGQTFTYRIGGYEVEVLGEGDLHDPSYNNLEHRVDANITGTNSFVGIGLSEVDNFITFQLLIYPSKELESAYKSSCPVIYTVIVIVIFLFTIALFLLYDYLVQFRQRFTARASRESNQIVESLYPSQFRDRIFHFHTQRKNSIPPMEERIQLVADNTNGNNDDDKNKRKRRNSGMSTFKSRFFNATKKYGIDSPDFDVGANMKPGVPAEAPIADFFPNVSVAFADLAGFTAWATTQAPNDVFLFLEALYWEFDQVAEFFGVFKVCAVGDCYLAATGLPEPMADHAKVITEFSIECLKKMEVVRERIPNNLQLRIGIHSGPVTAGILRGRKSRFELYGDTINTASRMESTGAPTRIQVSKNTANELMICGVEDWLLPREGLVSAKGKGNVQTYWIVPEEPINVTIGTRDSF
uniref:Guanylate cyclase domain-containing protein n=1 Tax=Attheya septentrionalis TaxID=420275 RepID=A0A7S2UU20_9STRA|mmetsp:Transcript_8930/g.16256  ORF Transcript_8930/g.16256 Transcript_8930/m.16256 type:complete len:722 (+) Transcript_8930:445-2610(+)|eukprot:CAMPEP_0198288884 /NCGR_PEP_ID=MMETSP1449-20131203/7252_1 /TAXON_ID=420275 /ORGANISM="Attheya septentrionalis, Strain CCMP2084" /LENGTH=721 /DNA_ID=CAMNT_0043987115 /DNA_START=67 /DNA_END=2232 /DNA_ORIENTATION=-